MAKLLLFLSTGLAEWTSLCPVFHSDDSLVLHAVEQCKWTSTVCPHYGRESRGYINHP